MLNTSKLTRRFISVIATSSLVLTGLLGAVIPAQATANNALAANETVAATALVEGKTLVVTGFAPNSTSLSAPMQKRIERFIENNPEFDFVRCLGFADRSGTPATNKRLGIERATAGCDVAVEANPDVEISRQAGKWNRQFTGADIRRVSITLSNYATANITTTFNANGGDQGVTTKRQAAGTPKVLGAPTRPGFIFAGWFTDQFAGTKVGNAGESYTPRKSQTLWAQWTAPSSGGSSSGGSSNASSGPRVSINFSLFIGGIAGMDADDQAQAVNLDCNIDGGREVAINYFVLPGTFANDSVSLGVVRIPNCSASGPGEVTFNGNLPADTVGSRVVIWISEAQIGAKPQAAPRGSPEWFERTYTNVGGFPEWNFIPTADGLNQIDYRGDFDAM
jgi:uncharacterized repeat protein (TIGR02543 family)